VAGASDKCWLGREGAALKTFLLKVVLAAGAALGLTVGAIAGTTDTATENQESSATASDLTEIIVTARRVEERMQDVPISMTVYNQAEITNRNIVNSADLAIYTPSLSMNNTLGNASAAFALRGFVQDIGTSPSVAVYFADVVAPRGGSNNQSVGDGAGPGSFFDLANVQVLKGPQGTLFGRNTTGGAILLVPKKPTPDTEGYVEAAYGNDDMYQVQAVFNTPLGDAARFRIGIDHKSRDGFVENTTGIGPRDFNNVDYTSGRASLVVDILPNLENYTILTGSYSDTNGEPMKLIQATAGSLTGLPGTLAAAQLAQNANAGFYTVQNDFPDPKTKLYQWQIINTTTWKASDQATLKNIISYAQLTYDLNNPVFGTRFDLSDANSLTEPLGVTYPKGTFVFFTGSIPLPGGNTAKQSTFTEEARLEGTQLGDRLRWQAGAYMELSDPLGDAGSVADNLLNCPNQGLICSNPLFGEGSVTVTEGKKTTKDYGLYAQSSYDITDQLTFTGGLRYTWDDTRVVGALTKYVTPYSLTPVPPTALVCQDPTLPAGDCVQNVVQDSRAPTWLVDFDYKPMRDMLLYAKYSRGYRTGGVTLQAPTTFQTFQPEKVDTYELGLKTSFSGPVKGTLDVAGFYNDFTNQQILIGFSPKVPGSVAPASGITNAGASTIYGAEVEAALLPVDRLSIDFGYTYLHTRVDRVSIPPVPPSSPYTVNPAQTVEPGDPLALSPENKYTITVAYTLPVPTSWGHIIVGPTFTHTDRQVTTYIERDASGKLVGDSYLRPRDLLDLNLNWNGVMGSRFDIGLFATNVTNQNYTTGVIDLGSYDFAAAQLGNPLFYGGRVRYNFGP
jgi:iron complex outermembrane receptor protein